MKWIALLFATGLFLGVYVYFSGSIFNVDNKMTNYVIVSTTTISHNSEKDIAKDTVQNNVLLPNKKILDGFSWVGQTFNNCSSVGLMIALSYWGIIDTQEKIAEGTRPWNNRNGNNDDKSVTLYELAMYTKNVHPSMLVYVRPNGDINLLKKFIANDIPVLTRTLMYPDDDIVHYRVVRGYDDIKKNIVETDGYYGKNYIYSYQEWMHLWKDFNYSYLIIIPKEKKELVEKLLGEDLDEKKSWANAKNRALKDLSLNKNDLKVNYNVITAMYYLGEYESVVNEFEKIEDKLTRRKLWYQGEPIEAYFKLEKYDRVIELVDYIANDNNKSISELYVFKGKILEKRGDVKGAKVEYEKALYYNKHLQSAKDALELLNI